MWWNSNTLGSRNEVIDIFNTLEGILPQIQIDGNAQLQEASGQVVFDTFI